MKKNNSGITLISLIITVIVLVILASIGITSGVSTVRSSQLTKFTTEMKIVQLKVNELYNSYTNNKLVTVDGIQYIGNGQIEEGGTEYKKGIQDIGKDIDIFNTKKLNEIFSESGSGITSTDGYKYYDTDTLKALNVDGVDNEFFVNVEKRSVVSIEGFNDYGKRYYTLEQVPEGLYNVEYNQQTGIVNFEISSEVIKGKGKIKITNIDYSGYIDKWQIRYRKKVNDGEQENIWNITDSFTGKEYILDIPAEDILTNYEIQVFHGDEIKSEIKQISFSE